MEKARERLVWRRRWWRRTKKEGGAGIATAACSIQNNSSYKNSYSPSRVYVRVREDHLRPVGHRGHYLGMQQRRRRQRGYVYAMCVCVTNRTCVCVVLPPLTKQGCYCVVINARAAHSLRRKLLHFLTCCPFSLVCVLLAKLQQEHSRDRQHFTEKEGPFAEGVIPPTLSLSLAATYKSPGSSQPQ